MGSGRERLRKNTAGDFGSVECAIRARYIKAGVSHGQNLLPKQILKQPELCNPSGLRSECCWTM
ncbi:hypothetical protein DWX41_11685 [Hungatella hathewayi]|uniref:Uncharacterized protein n=1 Tax=Hungatella hathewayi TaxID=154046 RepID=A0A3E2WVV9_9FIRM|nr:hypothetical protein [Faecalicatena contorta]RGC31881.1 hypothetical protein DWX41_11685 [Hungatella hathewayi]